MGAIPYEFMPFVRAPFQLRTFNINAQDAGSGNIQTQPSTFKKCSSLTLFSVQLAKGGFYFIFSYTYMYGRQLVVNTKKRDTN